MGSTDLGKKAMKVYRRLSKQEPWCFHPSFLESWYNENIKDGSKAYRGLCTSAANYLEFELTLSLSSIDEIVVGGSLGKGTFVKDQSDIDLFVFMNWDSIDTIGAMRYKMQLKKGQRDVEDILEGIDGVTGVRSDDFVVHFNLEYDNLDVRVDLLLTADNSHDGDKEDMMEAIMRKSEKNREYYSACLVKQRQLFIKSQPSYIKELIRLVKTWAHAALPRQLKKSYFLELLTVHLWEEAQEPARFDKAQGLKNVLQRLADLRSIQIVYWCDEEDVDEVLSRLNMKIPIILDPTNPTNNVCKFLENENIRKTISGAARATLWTTLCKDVTVYEGWSSH
ncbi:2'-5'-oligoadenylate synthase 1A-like [Asterias amurensis]|uniref:2'-5'-oligoadenylate synthase 1A-like n=1 Tax=Asterias amurensis TaxID=7602 RepID=UPI003AB89451